MPCVLEHLRQRIATEAGRGWSTIRAARPYLRSRPPERRCAVATRREVELKLRELIRRLHDADGDVRSSLAESLPDSKVIEIILPDLDSSYWTELRGGLMGPLHKGSPTQAEIRIRVHSDHLVELIDGRKSLFSSYVGGKVKIEASLTDLLRLRKLA